MFFVAEFRCPSVLPLPIASLENVLLVCPDHDRLGLDWSGLRRFNNSIFYVG